MMITKIIKSILHTVNLDVVNRDALIIFNKVYLRSDAGLKLPSLPWSIVSKSTGEEIRKRLSNDYIVGYLPEKNQLPQSDLLNWKPELDRQLTLQTALDYRASLSSNQYVGWFGAEFVAKLTVSNGRSFWRLETMRQLRAAYPTIFRGKVIEVGAGTGLTSCEISHFDETDEVYCLDYDNNTVENLMPLVQRSLRANAHKIRRVIGSYNNMDIVDNYFDAVVAVGSMHHSEDLDATMSECFRVLKPGGSFIVSDYALTGSLSQEEYAVLTKLPLDEKDASKLEETGSVAGMRTNETISEHERPLHLYLAAAFNAGFNVKATFFDATKDNGGHLLRVWRRVREVFKKGHFYSDVTSKRTLGYDSYGNVKAFGLSPAIRYPSYAKEAPGLFNLIVRRDNAGKPVYDNMVLVLQKPEKANKRISFQYRSGKLYHLPTLFDC